MQVSQRYENLKIGRVVRRKHFSHLKLDLLEVTWSTEAIQNVFRFYSEHFLSFLGDS